MANLNGKSKGYGFEFKIITDFKLAELNCIDPFEMSHNTPGDESQCVGLQGSLFYTIYIFVD